MKKAGRSMPVLVLFLFLAACSFPTGVPSTAPVQHTETPSPAPVIMETPTFTPTVEFTEMCAYVWSRQELPEVSQQLGEALQQAGLNEVEARASAYGENCLDPETNKVVRFGAMQTDFYLTIPVTDTGDTQALGNWIEKVLPVIAQFPPGQVPGPNPGYIGMRFTGKPEEKYLWFLRQKAQELAANGVSGSELFEALQNP